VRPDPASCLLRADPLGQAEAVTSGAERLTCAHCGGEGTAADAVGGWSVSTPPRPTGSVQPRPTEVRALCPACTRSALRDLEGRLDP
jgi:hypothetical protein